MNSAGDVRRVVSSITVSSLGTAAYNVGIAVYAYAHTHSAAWVAAATVGRYLPALALSWQAGRLADRFPRRSLAVACDLTSAVTMGGLTLAAFAHGPLVLLILIAAVSSTVSRVQQTAVLSLAADVVVESQLAPATLLINSSQAVATAGGSALAAAVLLGFSAPVLFLLNAASFFLSALCLSGVTNVPVRSARGAGRAAPLGSARRAAKSVRALLVTRTLVAFSYGADLVLLTVVASRDLSSGLGGYGWLLAASGAGGLSAAVLLRGHDARKRTATAATTGVLMYALPLLLFILQTGLAGGVAVQILRGVGSVLAASAVMAALQRSVPSELSGRIFGSVQSLVLVGTCVGAISAPLLINVVGLDGTLVVAGLVPAVLQLVFCPASKGSTGSMSPFWSPSTPGSSCYGVSTFSAMRAGRPCTSWLTASSSH